MTTHVLPVDDQWHLLQLRWDGERLWQRIDLGPWVVIP
jgi:hypothetical protein